jgi:hypothetical protein
MLSSGLHYRFRLQAVSSNHLWAAQLCIFGERRSPDGIGKLSPSAPLATEGIPMNEPSLVLSRVHWVRPELVAEVTFLEWTDDGLLRHVVYQGLREDKPAMEVRRDSPNNR